MSDPVIDLGHQGVDASPLPSITEHAHTGHGTVYVIVSWVLQDSRLNDEDSIGITVPWDVFIKGDHWNPDDMAWAQALGRTISMGVQQGVPLDRYVRTLSGIRCDHPHIARTDGQERTIESAADGVAWALHRIDLRLKGELNGSVEADRGEAETGPC
jgi:hypothetical protein